ncbi:MAG: P-II family nitrogen regulator [Proteobacteria bacterium]|nr:P-II family nitrogen regulator [Pseudomonadota bacterium]MBU1711375.1 P-II family nitrogen regulator [Pseudomonadota bacterium]
MKEIKAYIRTPRTDEVLSALHESGINNATLTCVFAVGPNIDADDSTVNLEFGRSVNRMVKLEVICSDRQEAMIVETIRKAAHTGKPGDGIISVANLNRVVKIRTAAESIEAL